MPRIAHPTPPVAIHAPRRALLVLAAVVAIAATFALVMVLDNDGASTSPALSEPSPVGLTGGPSKVSSPTRPVEGLAVQSMRIEGLSATVQPDGVRYDGGPEEGSALRSSQTPSSTRYDGGPEEGTASIAGR